MSAFAHHRSSVRSAFAAGLLAAAAAAQGGYRTVENLALGLEYPCARNYEAIPVPPIEPWVVAEWAEELPRDPDKRKKVRPTLLVVVVPSAPPAPPAPPATGEADPRPPAADEDAAEADAAAAQPIDSFERWVEQRLRGWSLGASSPGRERDGYQGSQHFLDSEKGPRGLAYVYRGARRTVVFFGFCHKDDWDEQTRIWRAMAEKARFSEPAGADLTKWLAYYERRPEFLDGPYRARMRSSLVRGWDADDTENYVFLFSTKDEPLLRILKRELEAIRNLYEELFPPSAPVSAVSTVRVCKDRDEYLQYGGPPTAGGHWHAPAKELVFFDYDSLDQKGKKKEGKANSRIVLYHEAFHQYIHYSTGELPPHSWFNEGTGDYFSGAVIQGDKVARVGVNPWRVGLIKQAIEAEKDIPWKEIVKFEQPEYYRPDRVGLCYAQGWAMIYFLRTSKDVARRPDWARILPTYFDVLKTSYAQELAALGEAPAPEVVAEAGKRARDKAVADAFRGVDFHEIEEAWKAYTLALRE